MDPRTQKSTPSWCVLGEGVGTTWCWDSQHGVGTSMQWNKSSVAEPNGKAVNMRMSLGLALHATLSEHNDDCLRTPLNVLYSLGAHALDVRSGCLTAALAALDPLRSLHWIDAASLHRYVSDGRATQCRKGEKGGYCPTRAGSVLQGRLSALLPPCSTIST